MNKGACDKKMSSLNLLFKQLQTQQSFIKKKTKIAKLKLYAQVYLGQKQF